MLAIVWSTLSEILQQELADLPDLERAFRILLRLFIAIVLGGLLGLQREWEGKTAGLRTHILVALGTALFVLVPHMSGMGDASVSRIIQGIITGIGFLGGGAILKLSEEHQVKGLTTAATIWVAAGIGIAVGLGRLWSAILSTAATLAILTALHRTEHLLPHKKDSNKSQNP
jgi:putative Mg2+ transporter-C (MgtC) family protein